MTIGRDVACPAVVDDLPDPACMCSCTSLISVTPVPRSVRSARPRRGLVDEVLVLPHPRAISSGGAMSPPSTARRHHDDEDAVLRETARSRARRLPRHRRRARRRRSRRLRCGWRCAHRPGQLDDRSVLGDQIRSSGIPASARAAHARRACGTRLDRHDRARPTREDVRSSSEQACPETCTGAISWWRTSAPAVRAG